MAKKLILGLIFVCLPQIWVSKNFFGKFYHDESLNVVLGYYPMQFKRKLMNQTLKNSKKLISGPILARLPQIWGPKFFRESCLYKKLVFVPNYPPT